jgi:hypothetical protein
VIRRSRGLILLGVALLVAALALSVSVSRVDATPLTQAGVSNDSCLECHAVPGVSLTLDDGESFSVYIDPDEYNQSVHGVGGYACVQCHTDLEGYPHPEFKASDRRDLALALYDACFRCHSGQYERTLDSVHQRALDAGNREAAVCTDCHGAHDTRKLTDSATDQLLPDARLHIPITCAECHNAIYGKYLTSVHGDALVNEGNLDVPTCINCHGVHNIEDPTTSRFRLLSPSICADCHTNPEIMDKYGLSTEVLNTYVADFHGTTVEIFSKVSPDAPTNKAVCYDCHGIHDIQSVSDPDGGLAFRENLLTRCQVCHPDATTNFSDAWLSHYIPSAENTPAVYYVNLFYSIFIPGLLGGMSVLVLLDITWQVRKRRAKNTEGITAEASSGTGPIPAPPPTAGADSDLYSSGTASGPEDES